MSDDLSRAAVMPKADWRRLRQICRRKRRFGSRLEALAQAHFEPWLDGRSDAYRCPCCKQWHLTRKDEQ